MRGSSSVRVLVALASVALFVGTALSAGVAQAASGNWSPIMGDVAPEERFSAVDFSRPRPDWYTSELHQKVLAAGTRGVQVDETHEFCQGVPDPANPLFRGVQAGACMVYPNGCTMSFVFTDNNGGQYIGTAGHCAEKVGDDVVIQIATRAGLDSVTIAKIGTVSKTTGDGGIGNDFALVKIDPGFAVSPQMPVVGGPNGVACGDSRGQPILHYGHGYHVEVQQGYPKGGVVSNTGLLRTPSTAYEWIGAPLGGDSGSGVVHGVNKQAIGNLTHGLGIDIVPIPGLGYGMRMSAIFDYLGSGYQVVNADGSTSNCGGTSEPPPPTANQAPVAAFTVQCRNTTTCTFDGSGSTDDSQITSYSWNFGDGATGSGASVSHTYPSAARSYTVTLTVTDDDGATDQEVKTVTCSEKRGSYRCS